MRIAKKLIAFVILSTALTALTALTSSAAADDFQATTARLEALLAKADPLCNKATLYACVPERLTVYDWVADWVVQYRISAINRDGSGRATLALWENWNEGDQIWEPFSQIELAYSSFENPDEVVISNWGGTDWTPQFRSTFTYNGQGKLLTELNEAYVAFFGGWIPNSLETFTLNGNGNPTWSIIQTSLLTSWVNSDRTTYTYSTVGQAASAVLLTEKVDYVWVVNQWQQSERYLFTYSGVMEIQELRQLPILAGWQDDRRYLTAYNGDLVTSWTEQIVAGLAWEDVSRDLFDPYDNQNRPLQLITQDWSGTAWLNAFRSTFEYDISTDVDDESATLPNGIALHQNYPNPFNPSTTISFSLPERAEVSIGIYDMLGRKVTDLLSGLRSAGDHTATWNGTDANGEAVATGVYFYKLSTTIGELSKKLLLMK